MVDVSFIKWENFYLRGAKEDKSVADAQSLYRLVSEKIETSNIELSPEVKSFLVNAFTEISNGKSADNTFLLKHSRGRKPLPFSERYRIAEEVYERVQGHGMTLEQAYNDCRSSNMKSYSNEQYRKLYYELKDAIQAKYDAESEFL